MAGISRNRFYMTDDDPPGEPYIMSSSNESQSDQSQEAEVADVGFAEEMYEIVLVGRGSSFKDSFEAWLAMYKSDPLHGVSILLQFLFRCCEARVPFQEMSDIFERPQLTRTSLPQAKWLSDKYLLVNPKYSANLVNFLDFLWQHVPEDFIVDDYLFDNLLRIFGQLCKSHLQAVRHTAVVAVTSLIPKIGKYRAAVLHEKAKLRSLQGEVGQIKKRMKTLNSFMEAFFKIFDHSRRDVIHQIRTASLQAMREVMKSSPASYFGKIAYFGQSLSDGAASVRLLGLKCLVSFLKLKDVTNVLVEFLADHKDQIQNLINGAGKTAALRNATQENIVRLIVFLHSHKVDQIQVADRNLMLYWISLENKTAARIAGNFILNFQNDDETFSVFDESERVLVNLVDFFARAKITNFSAYMKNLIDLVPALQDWDFMYNLLMKSYRAAHSRGLSAILLSSIEYVVAGRDRKMSSRMERKRMTRYFLPRLPEMLAAFGADSEQTAKLAMIPVYFEFSARISDEDEENVENLVRILGELLMKATNIEVFGSCIHAVISLAQSFHETYEETWLEILEELKLSFQPRDLLSPETDLDDFLQVAKKVERFLSIGRFEDNSVLDGCIFVLMSMPVDLMPRFGNVMLSITWLSIAGILLALKDDFSLSVAELLRQNVAIFAGLCANYMRAFEDVAEKAFSFLCNVLKYFCEGLERADVRLNDVVYVADREMVLGIALFIENTVFKVNVENGKTDVAEKNTTFLKRYLGLVEHGCIKMDFAGPVLRYMHKGDAQYGSTFKKFLLKLKSVDKLIIARVFHSALIGAGLYVKKRVWTQVDVQDLGNHLFAFVSAANVTNREIVKDLHALAVRFTIECRRDGFFENFLLEQMALFPLTADEDRLHVLQMATGEFLRLSEAMRNSSTVRKYLDMLEVPVTPGASSETNSPVSKKQKGSRTRSTRSSLVKRLDFT